MWTGNGGASAVVGRTALVSAVRTVLDQVSLRGRDVTLVVPDAAVRVLLLDFDELPARRLRRCRWCGFG